MCSKYISIYIYSICAGKPYPVTESVAVTVTTKATIWLLACSITQIPPKSFVFLKR